MHCLGAEVERLDATLALLARWVCALRSRVGQVFEVLSRVSHVAHGVWFGGEVQSERQTGIQMSAEGAPGGTCRCLRQVRVGGLFQMSAGDAGRGGSSRCPRISWRDIQTSAGTRREAFAGIGAFPDVCRRRRARGFSRCPRISSWWDIQTSAGDTHGASSRCLRIAERGGPSLERSWAIVGPVFWHSREMTMYPHEVTL
jgi:hypothetical protein